MSLTGVGRAIPADAKAPAVAQSAGGAYYFDGGAHLSGVAPVSGAPFTVAAWARGESSADTNTLVSIGSASVTHDLFYEAQLQVKRTSALTIVSGDYTGPFSSDGSALDTWHSHTGVFAASNDRRVYRDGGSEVRTSTNMTMGTPDSLRVGRWQHAGYPGLSFPLFGHVGYVFVWSASLSPQEIAAWHAGSIPQPGQLVAAYDLTRDWGQGSIPDMTGNGYDLTIHGATFDGSQSLPISYAFGDPPPPDTTPPVIGDVAASAAASTATVSWTTNEPATSAVDYGLTAAYGSTASDPQLVTSHSIAFNGLTCETTYHYLVSSTDAAGNQATDSDRTFTTASCPPPGGGSGAYYFNGSASLSGAAPVS
jgi:hypothetical protein